MLCLLRRMYMMNNKHLSTILDKRKDEVVAICERECGCYYKKLTDILLSFGIPDEVTIQVEDLYMQSIVTASKRAYEIAGRDHEIFTKVSNILDKLDT